VHQDSAGSAVENDLASVITTQIATDDRDFVVFLALSSPGDRLVPKVFGGASMWHKNEGLLAIGQCRADTQPHAMTAMACVRPGFKMPETIKNHCLIAGADSGATIT